MRISDWSSDVCSSDLLASQLGPGEHRSSGQYVLPVTLKGSANDNVFRRFRMIGLLRPSCIVLSQSRGGKKQGGGASEQGGTEHACQSTLNDWDCARSEEHTSELQSLMRISSSVFCLKKTTKQKSK